MKKLETLLNTIKTHEVDGVLLMSDYNRRWLTNFPSSAGYIFVNKEGKGIFLIDGRYFEAASKRVKNLDVRLLVGRPGVKFADLIKELMAELGIKKILLESEYVTLADLQYLGFKEGEYHTFSSRTLRIIKTEEEIKHIAKACEISAETLNWIRTVIKPGMTEKEVANMITIHQLELGASGNSFDPIVAAGLNGSSPHHSPTEYVIKEGDMVTCDIGALYEGYCSDITRSFIVGGVANNPEMVKIYEYVKTAQQLGVDATVAGATGKDVDDACRNYIESTEYKGLFGHGTGHGVGLEIHELPNTNSGNLSPLPVNSVVTVEPGIYKPGVGGVRIEDTIVVKEGKAINLTGKAVKTI